MSAPRMRVDHAAMSGLAASLDGVAEEFAAGSAPVRAHVDEAVAAAGEFASSLGLGAATFALSWTSAFGAYAQSCRLLSTHVGSSSLQLQAVDSEGAAAFAGPT